MITDISKLMTPPNFIRMKGISKQRVYILVKDGRLDILEMDGVKFIVMNEKGMNYKKQFPR